MKVKTTIVTIFTLLSFCVLLSSGGLMAGEGSDSKACKHASKMEGKCCNSGMCKEIKEHKAAMQSAAEKMGEHLIAMKEITNDEEWREEMEVHMGMIQAYVEQMSNCPMDGMFHTLKHGEQHHGGSESK